jgi:hypothetical protein
MLTVETFTSVFKGRGLAHSLPPPVCPQFKIFFHRRTLFPHRPATWAGSRAGSPVS